MYTVHSTRSRSDPVSFGSRLTASLLHSPRQRPEAIDACEIIPLSRKLQCARSRGGVGRFTRFTAGAQRGMLNFSATTIYFAMYFATDMTKVNRKIKEAPSVLTLAWHTYRPFELHRGACVRYTTDLPDR